MWPRQEECERSGACGLEELDGVAVRVFDLDLPASGAGLHLVAEGNSGCLELLDGGGKIFDLEEDSVPAAGLLRAAVRHGGEPEAPGPLRISLRLPMETWPNAGRNCRSSLKASCLVWNATERLTYRT